MAHLYLLDSSQSDSEDELIDWGNLDAASYASQDSEGESRYYDQTERIQTPRQCQHGESNDDQHNDNDTDNFNNSDGFSDGTLQPLPVDALCVFKWLIVQWWDDVANAHGVTHGDCHVLYRECTAPYGLELLYAVYKLESEPKECLGHIRYYATAEEGQEVEGAIELVARVTPAKFGQVEGGRASEADPRSNLWAANVPFPADRRRLKTLFVRSQVGMRSSTTTTRQTGSIITEYPGTDFDDGVMQSESTFPEAARHLSREDLRYTVGGSDDLSTSAFARPLTGLTRSDFVEFIMMSLFPWQIDPQTSISTPYGSIIFTAPSLVRKLYHDGLPCDCPGSLAEVPAKALLYCYDVPRNPNDPRCPHEKESRAVIQIWGELCREDPDRFIPKLFDMLLNSSHCADVHGALKYMEISEIPRAVDPLFKDTNNVLLLPNAYRLELPPTEWADRVRTLRLVESHYHEVSDLLCLLLEKIGFSGIPPECAQNPLAGAEYQVMNRKQIGLFKREALCLLRACMMTCPATAFFQVKPDKTDTYSVVSRRDGLLSVDATIFVPRFAERRLAEAHWPSVDFRRPDGEVLGLTWKNHLLAANVALFLFAGCYDIALKQQNQGHEREVETFHKEETPPQRPPVPRPSAEASPETEHPAVARAETALRDLRVDVPRYIQTAATFALSASRGCSGKGQLTLHCDWDAAGCDPNDTIEYQVHNAETCRSLRYLYTVSDTVQNRNFSCLDRLEGCTLPADSLDTFHDPALRTRHGCARVVYPARLPQALFVGLNPETWYFGVAINHARPAHPVLVTAWPSFPRADGDSCDETAHFDELERHWRQFRSLSCSPVAHSGEGGGEGGSEAEVVRGDTIEAHDEPEDGTNIDSEADMGRDALYAMDLSHLKHTKPVEWQGTWPEQAGDKVAVQRIVN